MTEFSASKKVIVEIKGGVGNQMFQYAAAKTLSLEMGAELLLENKLGFVLDRQYRGKFQLDAFPITYSSSDFKNSIPLFVDRVKSFSARRTTKKGVKRNSQNYLFDRDFHFLDIFSADRTKKRFWLSGYYQDPRYFESRKAEILKDLTPPTPTDQRFNDLAGLGRHYDLIALGFRMYEESAYPEAHARNGVTKSIEEYQGALDKLLQLVPNPLVLVFTSKEFEFLKSLKLPLGSVFVNPDRGYASTIDTLWLMSMCKHHIFNNSTFYWWGAVLSQMNYDQSEQRIYCANNFLNPDIGYPSWESF